MYNCHTLSIQSFVKTILKIRKLLTRKDSHVTFGNNNIRCVRDGKEGEGPGRLFFEGGLYKRYGSYRN